MSWQEQIDAAVAAAMDDGATSVDVEQYTQAAARAEADRRTQATARAVYGRDEVVLDREEYDVIMEAAFIGLEGLADSDMTPAQKRAFDRARRTT